MASSTSIQPDSCMPPENQGSNHKDQAATAESSVVPPNTSILSTQTQFTAEPPKNQQNQDAIPLVNAQSTEPSPPIPPSFCISLQLNHKDLAPRADSSIMKPQKKTVANTAANLANLLPTGTVLVFQALTPSLANTNGKCHEINKMVTKNYTMVSPLSKAFGSSTSDVLHCFFPDGGGENEYSMVLYLPVVAGVLSSFLFSIFPTERKGFGYGDTNVRRLG
ncbi:pollen-specific leucine-rich repeat extensin-like protein 3 [Fagus crenata]